MSKVISYKEPKEVPWTEEEAQHQFAMSLEEAKEEGYSCVYHKLQRVQHLIKQPCLESRECAFWTVLETWSGCAVVSMAHDLNFKVD